MQSQFSSDQNHTVPPENRITYFGLTDSRNKRTPFGIKREDRTRHSYVIGKTGMGKSTLLENMAIQDIQNGEGICFIDPHGGTAEKLLDFVPEERVKDVLYFAPFDLQYPISFNVLENVDADKRHFVVSGLMSTFEKIWVDAWSARMSYILQNTLAALLEFPGATLLGVNRMYSDKEYRKNVIAKITDPAVRTFWVDEYSKYTDRYTQEATPAIQNKVGQFASNALVRNIIGQERSAFDIRALMDERKIFIVNLSKGRVGEGNANLLGSMLITKIYLAAMSRADSRGAVLRALPDFYLYVDEFQNFANKSFADILSEARKYKLCLTVAHQYIEQMEEEVRAAVFGNVGTMMTFRVGAYDADVLEKEFAPVFEAADLVNLGRYQLYLKLMIDGVSSQPFSAETLPPIELPPVNNRDRVIAFSRSQYSRPRAEVEKDISDWMGMQYGDAGETPNGRAQSERRGDRANGTSQQSGKPISNTNGNTTKIIRERSSTPSPIKQEQRPAPVRVPKTSPPIQDNGDLRSVLTRVAPHVPKLIVPKPASAPISAPSQGQKQEQKFEQPPRPIVPLRNDGKGVTDEGKAELRNLLASLTNGAQQNVVREAAREKTPPAAMKQAPRHEQNHTAPIQGTVPPVELPEQEMRDMLRVDKPDIG